MRFVGAIALSLCLSVLCGQPALAEKRVALAIGNANYRNVGHLSNPANDATMLAATLKQARFDVVTLRTDLTANEMRRALRDFGDRARDADVAVIYYAGHGLEVDGTNYLIPIDAALERDTDVYDEALPLDRLLVAVEPAKQLRLVILDACRDNPFAKTMKRTVAQRAIGRGLAKVEPSSPNTMIAFAAKAGLTAFDGDSKNSPYAVALTAHLTTPGLDIRKAFGFIRDDVLKATDNRQEPFIYGSLGGNDVALVPAAPAPTASPMPDPNEAARRDYEMAERVGTREGWDTFLSGYPNGFYSKLAQAQRNKLVADEKARTAAEEKARLAAEGARAAEQSKAAADAKAADDARVAAEKKKALEEAKVVEAERAAAVAQAKAAEDARIAAEKAKRAEEEKAARERAAAEKKAQEAAAQAKAAEDARIAAEKASLERIAKAEEQAEAAAAAAKAADEARAAQEARASALQKALEDARAAETRRAADAKDANEANTADKQIGPVASLSPADRPGDMRPANEAPRLLQTELRRLGCYTGSIDGNWNETSQRALTLFNKSAGTTLDVKTASFDTLDVLQHRSERVCPLVCDHGYKPEGESCSKIVCKSGYEVGDDNTCERIRGKPAAKHEASAPVRNVRSIPSSPDAPRSPSGYNPSDQSRRVTAGGYETCGHRGCQIVPKGCTAVRGMGGHGLGGKIFCP
jgi:uncharacterized caspase-like protein